MPAGGSIPSGRIAALALVDDSAPAYFADSTYTISPGPAESSEATPDTTTSGFPSTSPVTRDASSRTVIVRFIDGQSISPVRRDQEAEPVQSSANTAVTRPTGLLS